MPLSPISPANQIESVIRSASQRRTLTLVIEQSALAFALIFAGSILMLLLGTQILDWYWLVLLGAVGGGVAAFRILQRRMAPYRVAQVLDQKFRLSDALSTAWFLRMEPSVREDWVARFQIAHAEELARTVHPAEAFPFTWRRAWAVTGALAAVAFGLFALRYMVTSSLSLRQAFIPIHLDSVFERSPDPRALEAQRRLDVSQNDQSSSTLSSATHESTPPSDAPQPQEGKESTAAGTGNSTSPSQNADRPGDKKAPEGGSQAHEGGQPGSDAKAGSKSDPSLGRSPGTEANRESKEQSGSGKEASSGLMDKMKDALNSMMAKMHPGQNAPGTPQDDKHQNSDAKTGNPNSTNKDQAGQQQNAGNQQAGQDQNSSGQAQGETKERAQASQGQSSDQSTESGSDSRSGVGSQDGDKGLKEANQLQAMGKLEEIIGKRSANLTGEMSVETPSGKQQLKTAYSQRQGHHADLGGEINRDEIPLIYQSYVREYMEQVRKQGNSGR